MQYVNAATLSERNAPLTQMIVPLPVKTYGVFGFEGTLSASCLVSDMTPRPLQHTPLASVKTTAIGIFKVPVTFRQFSPLGQLLCTTNAESPVSSALTNVNGGTAPCVISVSSTVAVCDNLLLRHPSITHSTLIHILSQSPLSALPDILPTALKFAIKNLPTYLFINICRKVGDLYVLFLAERLPVRI
jgi:hypothetical protein